MSKDVRSLFIGATMLVVGLILAFTGQGVEIAIFSLDKVGIVLAILGGIELIITGWVMLSADKEGKDI